MARIAMQRRIVGLGLWLALSVSGVAAQSLGDDPAFVASRQATEAFNNKDYRQAESFARQAIAAYPQHLLAHYLLGQVAIAEAQWNEAIQAFSTVVSLYPRCFVGQRDLGIAFEQAKRLDEAVTAYQTALTILPDNADVQARLAFVHLQAGRQDAAFALLKPLAEHGTKVPDVWAVLGRLWYDAKNFPESEKALSRAADLRDDGKVWFNLGAVRLHLDDSQGALAAFERAARHAEMQEQARREIDKLRQSGKVPPSTPSRTGPAKQ